MDRIRVVDKLFKMFGKFIAVFSIDYGWSDEFGIICETSTEANVIADLFDDLYGEGTCVVEAYEKHYCVRNW